MTAEQAAPVPEVTFTKDIAPILQRSCQNCHRPGQVAPMSLITYEEARPWARSMKQRTGLRDKAGVMPPWYIEKNIGIQHYKHDPSLSDEEIAKVAKWADTGAPRGNPADLPPPISFPDGASWHAGEPDLIVESPEITVKANTPDWWGEFEPTKIPLTEDRYVASVEIREVNDFAKDASGRDTVGQRYVWHHLIWATAELTGDGDPIDASIGEGAVGWPVHEVGRNADVFEPNAGRLLKANSSIIYQSAHLHAGGADVKSKLLFGFKFHPKGYKPARRSTLRSLGNGLDIDIKPNEANQQLHAYMVLQQPTKIATFEPHLHAPGQRMCLEAIWGIN
ncbi:MAG: cytochrome c, partial [Acidobacteriota bacterium]|nr:cytochrome c [Acidobacteriota bacterium]